MPDTFPKPSHITPVPASNAFGDDEDTVIIQKKATEPAKPAPVSAAKAKTKGKKG
ncbi:MAG TPA: hypothetical protein PKY30_11680 [Myxococcota bacterium]|nr:hypothetical protein [Myxococcota bacterium]